MSQNNNAQVSVDAQELHELIEAYKANGSKPQWYNGLAAMVPLAVVVGSIGVYLVQTGGKVDWIMDDKLPAVEKQIDGVKADLTTRMDRERTELIRRLDRIESILLEIASHDTTGATGSNGAAAAVVGRSEQPRQLISEDRWTEHQLMGHPTAAGGGPGVPDLSAVSPEGH